MPQKKETTDRAPPSRAPGSAQPLAVLAGMSETGPHTLPKGLALEGGEHGQQRSHCTTRRSGQVERLGQRHEANAEMLKFMQSREQVGDRSSPAVQTPHHNNVDLSSPCRFQQFLPELPLCCSGADFFHLHGDGPAAPGSVLTHSAALLGERLLVQGGDTSIQAGANHFGGFLPLAKNPPGFPGAGPLFYGHFTMLPVHGRRLSFPAMWDSS